MMSDDDKRKQDVLVDSDEVAVISPYAGGGGGSTLGHRVATSYLADMLLGGGRQETDELPVVRLAFQTNPTDPVDDLRVEAESGEERVTVYVAVRRVPQFVKRNAKTAELVGTLLDQVDLFGEDERAYVAVAVTAMTKAQTEVQLLASLARANSTEAEFHFQVHQPKRFAGYANRYEHLIGLAKKARPWTPEGDLQGIVWGLLNRLWILNFRVESDDETDWVEIGNRLNPLAREGKSGADVRNELHSAQATQFDQMGAVVDLPILRRKLHSVLAIDAGRSKDAWTQLYAEQESAMIAVRHVVADSFKLPRTKLLAAVQNELTTAGVLGPILITGQSGTGKSALTLSAAAELADVNCDFEYAVLNLRKIRDSVAALSADLRMPLTTVLSEMSAPSRILIVDAADAAAEGRGPLLRELAAAAHAAKIGLALIVSDTAVEDVANALVGIFPDSRRFEVTGLDDAELQLVREDVPAIAGALRSLPRNSLYRRLVVIDLLARTGITVDAPLDDWQCLELIWTNLFGRARDGRLASARTDALLAMSEAALELPTAERIYGRPDPAALDSLRTDLLVAPANLRKSRPEFAHDEVRRIATAVRLAQADCVTETLQASGPMRWSMSAAKLACEGQLADAADPNAELAALVSQFDALATESTIRWKDVPLEAVLEMSNAYGLLRHMLNAADPTKSDDVLATFVRVVSLHQRHENMVDVVRGEAVVRLIVEEIEEPWSQDDEVFGLLCEWLNSALLESLPAGNSTRMALGDLLFDYWHTHRPPTTPAGSADAPKMAAASNSIDGYKPRRRRQRNLGWKITQERYIQVMALLGPDINDEVRACLTEVAADSPARLQPAVDLGWSAWGLGSYDPKFLLELTETYYIDSEGGHGWLWTGIRDHQSRGYARLCSHEYGPFWAMIRMCPHGDWIPVANRILNHASNVHCRAEGDTGPIDPSSKFTLAIDGTERIYVGDSNVWGWYRGNTNGPYPCMSALQAIERWIDQMVTAGPGIEMVSAALLNGCENLAMPGLVVGAMIRHFGDDPNALDRFLVEPLIWQFDSSRATRELVGFMLAPDDGITNPERRKMPLRDFVWYLVLNAGPQRRAELRDLGTQLVTNATRFDPGESTIRRWAAVFDSGNLTTEPTEGGVLVSVREPEDIEEELAPIRADLARGDLLVRLQNKYWIPVRQQKDGWAPPSPAEIAADLELVKDLHKNPPGLAASDPDLAVAHIAAAAVRTVAEGHVEALGKNATFAITSLLRILGKVEDGAVDDIDEHEFHYDIGTRGAAASALPHLLLPELAEPLSTAGVTHDDVAAAAATLGTLSSTDTCLQFAQGCDTVWAHPCSGNPCIHLTTYQWALDLTRNCEIGEFDENLQRTPTDFITSDVMTRIPEIPGCRLDTSRLSATIRALGRASSSRACVAETAQRDLIGLLQVQSRAMVIQETSERAYFIDDKGAETMSAARALLHTRSRVDASDELMLEYVTTLAPASHVLGAFLRDLAAVGAETQELADMARGAWPILFGHVLDHIGANDGIFEETNSFNDYALSRLLPNPPGTTQWLHNELGRHTFDWANAIELVEYIPRWLPSAAGRRSCLLELIRFIRQLPIETQLSNGLAWIDALCLTRPGRQLPSYAPMDEWLMEIKPIADSRGVGSDWLNLVDRLVYAGNRTLAGYSR